MNAEEPPRRPDDPARDQFGIGEGNEQDDLIRVPPLRKSRKRKVKLVKRGKDRPAPAEYPE